MEDSLEAAAEGILKTQNKVMHDREGKQGLKSINRQNET